MFICINRDRDICIYIHNYIHERYRGEYIEGQTGIDSTPSGQTSWTGHLGTDEDEVIYCLPLITPLLYPYYTLIIPLSHSYYNLITPSLHPHYTLITP
jgi:hypothetical protein